MTDIREPVDATDCLVRITTTDAQLVAAVCPDGMILRSKTGNKLFKIEISDLGILTITEYTE